MKQENNPKIILMSIASDYAKLIFDEEVNYKYQKKPIELEELDKKIYVYSSKKEKAIIGYFKISDILNIEEIKQILRPSQIKRSNLKNIIQRYDTGYILKLYDVTEFAEYLRLKDLRKIIANIKMPETYTYIYPESPLYELITEWDKAYSLDGNLKTNPTKVRALIKK